MIWIQVAELKLWAREKMGFCLYEAKHVQTHNGQECIQRDLPRQKECCSVAPKLVQGSKSNSPKGEYK